MTDAIQEAVPMLVRQFGRVLNYNSGPEYSFTPAQFDGLIAEVCRQEAVECRQVCRNLYVNEDDKDALDCANAIRARYQEGK